jgi:hypothetical protein
MTRERGGLRHFIYGNRDGRESGRVGGWIGHASQQENQPAAATADGEEEGAVGAEFDVVFRLFAGKGNLA